MNTKEFVQSILPSEGSVDKNSRGDAFAPANIALCKYWGKRNAELNLPMTDSLSVTLGDRGTRTILSAIDEPYDIVTLNDQWIKRESHFYQRIEEFLSLVRPKNSPKLFIQTYSNIPTAAGLASSASGFAALTLACDQFFDWQLSEKTLTQLARLGSGSACRSIWPMGFAKWHVGKKPDGTDCYAEKLSDTWPELCIGLLMVSSKEKPMSSREAMQRTVETSKMYAAFVEQQPHDMMQLELAIQSHDFELLGEVAEANALAMHETMKTASPAIDYCLLETLELRQKVWSLRDVGVPVYFTQDAGPNLKLLFLKESEETIKKEFPLVEIIEPFNVGDDMSTMHGKTEQPLVLVNDQDEPIGLAEKQQVHEQGLCHRAFSFFLVRKGEEGYEVLLQQRAADKYHWPNIWANTCCSHPYLGETIVESVKRRVKEELGLMIVHPKEIDLFHYTATCDNGLIENEVDHVFVAFDHGEEPVLNQSEVQAVKWVTISELNLALKKTPDLFSPWLEPAFRILEKVL